MTDQENGIVVGVDGSPASVAALRWSISRARAEGCQVTAVEVHAPPHYLPGTSYSPAPYGTAPPAERQTSRLAATVAAALAAEPEAPEIVELFVEGEPDSELARIANDGRMLVLGRNTHGRISELLLGHVTSGCLRRARWPVVLVPADRTLQESR